MTVYENPSNGYKEEFSAGAAFFLTLLFGPIYFAVKGAWGWAIACLVGAIVTMWLSTIIFAFMAPSVIQKQYLQKGWIEKE